LFPRVETLRWQIGEFEPVVARTFPALRDLDIGWIKTRVVSEEDQDRWDSLSPWDSSQLSLERLSLYTSKPFRRVHLWVFEWLAATNSVNTLRAVAIDWPTTYGMETTKRVFTSLFALEEVQLYADGNADAEYCTCGMVM
jgi:hypothetical protein